ncbi:hypothetical protein FHL15_007725 [Xylaria flabelliformis]|uniref:Uncharacterized protein n=1 Tax=Xylaria flabelliformis TaxID=2512241 RepID=A0A553HTM5_9PEZI|nr:hypothetical protein FHL15_007725 [Xylaria flabelliformis]
MSSLAPLALRRSRNLVNIGLANIPKCRHVKYFHVRQVTAANHVIIVPRRAYFVSDPSIGASATVMVQAADKRLAFIDETVETTANDGEEAQNSTPDTPNGPGIESEADERSTLSKSRSFPEQSDGIISLVDRYTSSPEMAHQIWQNSSVPDFGSEGIHGVGPIFDFVDREMNFARRVPEAAGSRPMLMRIISIVATRHQERLRGHQLPLVDTDDRPCNHSTRTIPCGDQKDGEVYAKCEEPGIQFDRNLRYIRDAATISSIERAAPSSVLGGDLARSLSSHLERTVHWSMSRQVQHLLEFCFGSREVDAYAYQKYESLAGYLTTWASTIPESFEPLLTRLPEGGEVFPEIVFLSHCAMAAWHCYHLTRMLLIARMGSGYMAAMQSMDNEIKSDVRVLYAIAETHGNADRSYLPVSPVPKANLAASPRPPAAANLAAVLRRRALPNKDSIGPCPPRNLDVEKEVTITDISLSAESD